MPQAWVAASAATLAVPAIVALFTQSLVVFVVLFAAAVFSLLYHLERQESYATVDTVWASMAVLLVGLLALGILKRHGAGSWRFWAPVAVAAGAGVVYLVDGHAETAAQAAAPGYQLWHPIWHVLGSLAALLVVVTPVDLRDLAVTGRELTQ